MLHTAISQLLPVINAPQWERYLPRSKGGRRSLCLHKVECASVQVTRSEIKLVVYKKKKSADWQITIHIGCNMNNLLP